MDPVLAELYGTTTVEPSPEELEKTAQLELLEKIAEENGIDVDKLSDEEIVDAYNELTELLNENDSDPGETQDGQEKVAEDEAAALAQEADMMGRIMAHAYVQELRGIESAAVEMEKEAGAKAQALKALPGKLHGKVRRAGGKILERLIPAASEKAKTVAGYGALAAGAAGAGGAGYGGYRGGKKLVEVIKGHRKEKKSSDIVEQRALEFLAEAGLVGEDGSIVPPEALQKTAEDDRVAIDTAALQLLEEMGYPVEWNQ